VTIDARPSRIKIGIQDIFGVLDVNGDATEASVSDKLTPAWAIIQNLNKYLINLMVMNKKIAFI